MHARGTFLEGHNADLAFDLLSPEIVLLGPVSGFRILIAVKVFVRGESCRVAGCPLQQSGGRNCG